MNAVLLPLWGSFAINSYGLFIALATLIFTLCISKDIRFKWLGLQDSFGSILIIGACALLLGGRLFHIISEQEVIDSVADIFSFWQGGLSVLGATIGVLLVVPLYLIYLKIPVLPFFDLVAIYAGLLQGIARIGCFTAGCCHGTPTQSWLGIVYTDVLSAAPLHVKLHPTQLYSSLLFLIIFGYMFFIAQHRTHKKGQLAAIYLMLSCIERFFGDFLRAERVMVTHYFSYNQIVALVIFTLSLIGFILITHKKKFFGK